MIDRRVVAVAALLVVVPIFWDAWSAGRDGWAPEGDGAAIIVRSHDVFSTDPPLLGNPATVGSQAGSDLHHPGPLEYVALAVPVRLLGSSGVGALLGVALLGAASVAAIAWLALRNGGPTFAVWVLAGAAALTYGLGREILHDVYNPHVLLLPYALLVVCVFAAACGDRVALPVAVLAASFVAQAHAFYALLAAIIGVVVAVVVARAARPDRRWWAGSAAFGLLLWIPPLLAEARPGPSNLAGLLRAGAGGVEGDAEPALGPGFAVARLADTLLGFRWLDRRPDPLALIDRPAAWLQVAAVLLVLGLAVLGLQAHRAGRRVVAGLVAAAMASTSASLVAAARLPGGLPLLEAHNHRHWWVTGALFWTAAVWASVDLLRGRLRSIPPRVRIGVVAIPLAVAAVATAWHPSIDADRGSSSFAPVEHLTEEVAAALPSDGPWLLTADGAQAFVSVQPGMVAGLVLRGVDVRIGPDQVGAMGSHRLVDGPVAGTILVASGVEPPAVPPGYELVARFDAVGDAERTGHTATVLYESPEQLAVFLAVDDPVGEPATAGGG